MTDDDEQKRRNQQIGRNLQKLRGERSQQRVADYMRDCKHKWSQSTVWSVEKGDRPLRLTEAKDLAAFLEVQLGDLLDLTEEDIADQKIRRAVDELNWKLETAISAYGDYLFSREMFMKMFWDEYPELLDEEDDDRAFDEFVKRAHLTSAHFDEEWLRKQGEGYARQLRESYDRGEIDHKGFKKGTWGTDD